MKAQARNMRAAVLHNPMYQNMGYAYRGHYQMRGQMQMVGQVQQPVQNYAYGQAYGQGYGYGYGGYRQPNTNLGWVRKMTS